MIESRSEFFHSHDPSPSQRSTTQQRLKEQFYSYTQDLNPLLNAIVSPPSNNPFRKTQQSSKFVHGCRESQSKWGTFQDKYYNALDRFKRWIGTNIRRYWIERSERLLMSRQQQLVLFAHLQVGLVEAFEVDGQIHRHRFRFRAGAPSSARRLKRTKKKKKKDSVTTAKIG